MLLRGILAAVVGTVFMTLSSTSEQYWVGRQPSVVPGQATARLLRPFGIKEVKGRALDLLAYWTHWVYGTLWGVLFWALVDPAGLPLGLAGVVFFLAVWGAEQIHLPVLKLAPWPWKWGLKYNLIDAWHHVTYAGGTVLGWHLIGLVR
ncbi:MAG: hypothetical protein HY658_07575 [Actinobacteria bacterium]|nr:hypothetical protein [Actinomycetota bacterium]